MCRGNADEGDESYYPKLSKVREIAMRPAPGGRGTLYPPAWISFLTEDVLNRDGSVRRASCGLEVREKQLKTSEYDQKRKLRDDREKERAKELACLLCNKPKKGDKDGSRGSGAVREEAKSDDASAADPPSEAPAPSGAERAAVYATRRKRRDSERGRGFQKLGKLAMERKARLAEQMRSGYWVAHDLACIRNKDQCQMAGLLVGPAVRSA